MLSRMRLMAPSKYFSLPPPMGVQPSGAVMPAAAYLGQEAFDVQVLRFSLPGGVWPLAGDGVQSGSAAAAAYRGQLV